MGQRPIHLRAGFGRLHRLDGHCRAEWRGADLIHK